MAANFRVAVVLPLYRSELAATERVSVARCCELLGGKYDLFVLSPIGVNMDSVAKLSPHLKFKTVDSHKMASIKEYNKLLLSNEFYEMFSEYEYMLIYQADCLIFEDRIEEWLEKGYDYIGAPWYFRVGYFSKITGKILRTLGIYHGKGFLWGKVGNGGFSLRKISSFIEHLKRTKRVSQRAKKGKLNEDVYFSLKAKSICKPKAQEAALFCADMTPTICPKNVMAAHGWNKTPQTIEFWKQRIKDSGISFEEI